MKKFIYSMFAIAFMAMTFVSCADVPAPYDDPNGKNPGEITDDSYLNETFKSSFGDFTVNNIKGNAWKIDYSSATATGYNGAGADPLNTESESYLVSPAVDLTNSKGAYLQFSYVLRFANQGTNKVLITDNYTGDPTTTTWTDITGTLKESPDYNTFNAYAVNLPTDFIGKPGVVVALYYATGADATGATTSGTWEVQSLLMKEGQTTGGGGGGTTPPVGGTGTGTETDPYNVTAALSVAAQNGSTAPSDKVYITGTVVSVVSGSFDPNYGSLKYYISDDGTATNQLYIYNGYSYNGDVFTGESDLKPGDKVVIMGALFTYSGTAEVNTGSQIVTLNGKGGGTTPPPPVTGDATLTRDANVVTLVDPTATASTDIVTYDLSTAGLNPTGGTAGIKVDGTTLTLSDGTTITFAQNAGTTSPSYYEGTKGVRMYPQNSLTIAGVKAIASVVLTCDYSNSTYYTGNGTNAADGDEVVGNISGNTWSIQNGTTIKSGGTQLRVQKIQITYAQ